MMQAKETMFSRDHLIEESGARVWIERAKPALALTRDTANCADPPCFFSIYQTLKTQRLGPAAAPPKPH